MKITSQLVLLVLIAGSITVTSCNKEEKQKQKLEGKWIYESAKKANRLFHRLDILDTYRYLDVYFTKEGEIKIIDVKDSLVFLGTYALEDETSIIYTDEDGNNIPITETQMFLSYRDTAANIIYEELWENLSIRKNKIGYSTEIDEKSADFVLRRQLD